MKRNVSVVRLIVATQSSGLPASGKIIKEMSGSVASGMPYTYWACVIHFNLLFVWKELENPWKSRVMTVVFRSW